MKIFGREPTLIIAAITAAISIAGTLGFGYLTGEQAGLLVIATNAVAGAVTAYMVRPISPVAFTYLIGSLVALGTAYGLNIAPETVAMINAAVVPLLALLTREQVAPVETVLTTA